MLFWRLIVRAKNVLFIQRDKLRADRAITHGMPGPSMLEPDAPFYLMVNHFKSSVQGRQNDCTWFKVQPMGVNKLNSILKDMCEAEGIPRKTNHAGRKTLVQKLQDNDVPPNQIIQITGHRNLQSINNYSSLRERQMENI